MKHVLHLGKLYPPDAGGIESVTATLARGAAAQGWQVTVLCFGQHAVVSGIEDGVRVIRVRYTLALSSQPLSLRYLREALKVGRSADVVHVHTPNMLAALASILLGRGPRVVVHWHSDVVGKGLLGRLLQPLERALLRRADRIICTSQPYAEASPALADFRNKVVVVPSGVPDVVATKAVRTTDNLASNPLPTALRSAIGARPIILSVGRLVPYKGYDVLIDAAAQLRSDAVVVIVGGGPLYDELRGCIDRLGVRGKVLLAGRLNDETLANLLRAATVFCLPSTERSEAFGVALVEAMAYGLPVVATQIAGSGVPWINLDGESGLNVVPGNATELAHALDRMLSDAELRARFAIGARARFEALFTEQQFIDATLNVYRALV